MTMAMSDILAPSSPVGPAPGSGSPPVDSFHHAICRLYPRRPEVRLVSKVLLLTRTADPAAEILPSLSLLDHTVRLAAPTHDLASTLSGPRTAMAAGAAVHGASSDSGLPDVVLVDARRDLIRVKELIGQ